MKLIFEKIKNLNYAKIIYKINNESAVRKYSKKKEKFSYSHHLIWLKRQLRKNSKEKIFLTIYNKKIIGLMRIRKHKKRNYLSWVIKKEFRRKNLGLLMLSTFVKLYRKKYYAFIKKNNIRSIKICEKAGFSKYRDGSKFNYFIKK